MDVRCDNCGTTYQIDAARIPPQGARGECGNCGHRFIVRHPGSKEAGLEGAGVEGWLLRQPDGNTIRFHSVDDLHQWSVAQTSHKIAPPHFHTVRFLVQHSKKWFRKGVVLAFVALVAVVLLYRYEPERMRALASRIFKAHHQLTVSNDSKAREQIKIGFDLLRQDSDRALTEAAGAFLRAADAAPGLVEAKAGLAEVELRRVDQILEAAEDLEAKPKAIFSAQLRGLRSQATERLEQAFALLSQAESLDADSIAVVRAAAEYYRLRGIAGRLEEVLAKGEEIAPKDTGLAFSRAAAAAAHADSLGYAIDLYATALQRTPSDNRLRYGLARALLRRGLRDRALVQLKLILTTAPDHERAKKLILSGRLTAKASRKDLGGKAVGGDLPDKGLEKTASAAAGDSGAAGNRSASQESLIVQGNRLREADQPEKALQLFKRAVQLNAENAEALTGVGWCYIDLDDPEAALENFEQALEVAPRFAAAHLGMAQAFEAQKNLTEAAKYYRSYLGLNPTGEQAEDARSALQQLQQQNK